jgi:hypothetical protein
MTNIGHVEAPAAKPPASDQPKGRVGPSPAPDPPELALAE